MGSENAHGCAQNAENGYGFDILEPYHKDANDNHNHIKNLTAHQTWVTFVNAETKEQSKQWMHTHSSNKPNVVCHKADGKCFLGQESAEGGIHATMDYSTMRHVL
jgi:tRNA(Leu) C34 or U34 (ribose-2'-O)-methylase TrmL